MERIDNFKDAGTSFVRTYYSLFDNDFQRATVRDFYDNFDSILIMGGEMFIGIDKIMEKYTRTPTVLQRIVNGTDCQPTTDSGVIINVYGRILMNDQTNQWQSFHEMFVLQPKVTLFYISNQHYRASSWNASMYNSTVNNNNNNNVNGDSLRFV
jgi:hypothetical protein